jgi:hypothetical protein
MLGAYVLRTVWPDTAVIGGKHMDGGCIVVVKRLDMDCSKLHAVQVEVEWLWCIALIEIPNILFGGTFLFGCEREILQWEGWYKE